AQVLIGKKQHAAPPRERPFQGAARVGACAHDSAVPSAKSLELGRRVDVSYRHEIAGVDDLAKVVPGGLDCFQIGHVGHAASGGQIGEIDVDLFTRQHVSGLGHEMHAAEYDVAARAAACGKLAELVAVAAEVGKADNLVLLIMVSKYQK